MQELSTCVMAITHLISNCHPFAQKGHHGWKSCRCCRRTLSAVIQLSELSTVVPTLLVSLPKPTCHQKCQASPGIIVFMGLISGTLAVHCSFQGLYIAPHTAHFTSPRQSMSISLQVLYKITSNKIPTAHLGVPLEAHAVVMGLRRKTRRCDVLPSRAGHFAPLTKQPWESPSRPMQSLWGSGGKRVGAMCYYHGRAILLPPPNTLGSPSRGPRSRYGAPAENASVRCAAITGWPLCSPHQTALGVPLEAHAV
ncbi:hypothetical protein B0H13DRAFT_2650102, partial [Mycena leptocephala]